MITYDNMEVKMMELIILPEIQRRLMPLQPEELAELERSVLEEGIRDPLVVWRKDGQLVLVDGHHRYELAEKHGLSFQIVEREFRDLDEVLIWVDRNQLGRRNLQANGQTLPPFSRQGRRSRAICNGGAFAKLTPIAPVRKSPTKLPKLPEV
jgi:ParB-like chromosome segregation protein Spo0J